MLSTINPTVVSISPFPSFVTGVAFSITQNYCAIITSIKNTSKENSEINIYPYPFTDRITVSNNTVNTVQLGVYNTLGNLVATKELEKNREEINLEELPPEIYFVKLNFENKTIIKRLIKE